MVRFSLSMVCGVTLVSFAVTPTTMMGYGLLHKMDGKKKTTGGGFPVSACCQPSPPPAESPEEKAMGELLRDRVIDLEGMRKWFNKWIPQGGKQATGFTFFQGDQEFDRSEMIKQFEAIFASYTNVRFFTQAGPTRTEPMEVAVGASNRGKVVVEARVQMQATLKANVESISVPHGRGGVPTPLYIDPKYRDQLKNVQFINDVIMFRAYFGAEGKITKIEVAPWLHAKPLMGFMGLNYQVASQLRAIQLHDGYDQDAWCGAGVDGKAELCAVTC